MRCKREGRIAVTGYLSFVCKSFKNMLEPCQLQAIEENFVFPPNLFPVIFEDRCAIIEAPLDH